MNQSFELFDYIYDGICIIDSEYKIIYWNNSLETFTGINREDILKQYLTDRYPDFNHPKYRMRIDLLFSGGAPVLISTQLNGTIFDRKDRDSSMVQEITISRIPSEKESENYAIFNVKDITELSNRISDFKKEHNMLIKEIEQREGLEINLKKSLEEKEILIKEVHHRVKNNLMLLGSLIDMQAWQIKDKKTISIFEDLRKRIDTIALIHEKMYQSSDLVSISSKEYLEDLIVNIENSLVSEEQNINIIPIIDNIKLNADTTIPLGLLVTEIITNSIKHAFSDNTGGDIIIKFTENYDVCTLTISDSGTGFPENFNTDNLESLGFMLIKSLTSQLNGQYESKNDGGAVQIITFNLPL